MMPRPTSPAVVRGWGVIQVPAYDVRDLVRSDELVEILPDTPPAPLPMSALYPERRHASGRVRAFIEWIRELHDTHMRDG